MAHHGGSGELTGVGRNGAPVAVSESGSHGEEEGRAGKLTGGSGGGGEGRKAAVDGGPRWRKRRRGAGRRATARLRDEVREGLWGRGAAYL